MAYLLWRRRSTRGWLTTCLERATQRLSEDARFTLHSSRQSKSVSTKTRHAQFPQQTPYRTAADYFGTEPLKTRCRYTPLCDSFVEWISYGTTTNCVGAPWTPVGYSLPDVANCGSLLIVIFWKRCTVTIFKPLYQSTVVRCTISQILINFCSNLV